MVAVISASWQAGQAGSRPGGRLTFLASPRKVSKRRRAGFVDPPLRYGHAALLGLGGVRANSLRSNMRAPFSAQSCATRLLITAGVTEYQYRTPQGRAMARPCLYWVVGFCLFGSLCRVAGLSSAATGGSGRALFERSEFSPTPPDASSARNPAGALTSARLLFAYFLLAKQEKVSRPRRDAAILARLDNKLSKRRIAVTAMQPLQPNPNFCHTAHGSRSFVLAIHSRSLRSCRGSHLHREFNNRRHRAVPHPKSSLKMGIGQNSSRQLPVIVNILTVCSHCHNLNRMIIRIHDDEGVANEK